MKTFRKLFPIFLVCIFAFGLVFSAPTFAAEDNNAVSTTFFGDFKDDGKGCGVYMVLNTGLDILSMGIGIAAIIGILVSGTLYLTANGNENQIVKSKKRILEIVIGLAVYATLYAGLNFLLPGGKFNPNIQCESTTVSSNYGTTNKWRTKVTSQNDGASIVGKSSTGNSVKDYQKAINDMAISLAQKSYEASENRPTPAFKAAWVKYVKKYDTSDRCHRNYGKSCGSFASTVLAAVGADASNIKKRNTAYSLHKYMSKSKKWQRIKKPEAGTVGIVYNGGDSWHVKIFVKYKNKLRATEASHCDFWGRMAGGVGGYNYIYRYVGD